MPQLTRDLPRSRNAIHVSARAWHAVDDPSARVSMVLRCHRSLYGKLSKAIRVSRRFGRVLILPGFEAVSWTGVETDLITLATGSCCCDFAERVQALEKELDKWLQEFKKEAALR